MHQKKQIDFEEIVKLVNSPLKVGTNWYLLDKKWYDMCKAYHESGDKSIYPGPIDNSALLEPSPAALANSKPSNGFATADSTSTTTATTSYTSTSSSSNDNTKSNFWVSFFGADTKSAELSTTADYRSLRNDCSEVDDFILIPEECWNLLKEIYGVMSDEHIIRRRVIESAPGQVQVELRPVILKLCLYGGKEVIIERGFSKTTTVDELHRETRKTFNISSERESKLWINSKIYMFEQAGELSPSKSESNLQTTPPIKPPPTPPPMPNSNSSVSVSSLPAITVVTRQAANSMGKTLMLPDSSTSPNTRSASALASGTQATTAGTYNKAPAENQGSETLAKAGVCDAAGSVVTLEVINNDGTWPSSRPRYGSVSTRSTSSSKTSPGLCGLSNMGNTCFMNAALQCLSNTHPLTSYILTDKFVEDINASNPLGMHGEIARTYAELIKVMWSGNHSSFLPREFKCAVSRFAPQFNGFAQQDCQELMAFLLDGLHEDLNRIRNKPYIEIKNDIERRPDEVVAEESWSNYRKRNDSIVVDTFHGMLKSTLVCPGCKLVSVTFDPFCYLSLPLPVKREKQVNLTFLPAPSKIDESKLKDVFAILDPEEIKAIKQYGGSVSSFSGVTEEHAGYSDPTNRPKGCKIQVPRSGPASEICDIVARVINEERPAGHAKVKQDNLVVAELSTDGRISKVYESNEHYNQISDDILVVEKASNFVLPLYLRERKSKTSVAGSVFAKPLFLHVPDLKFDTLYKSAITSLSNLTSDICDELQEDGKTIKYWIKLVAPTEDFSNEMDVDSMDCDHDSNAIVDSTGDGDEKMETTSSSDSKTNGNSHKKDVQSTSGGFDLCIVNSFGNHSIETLGPNRKECDYSSKLYLGATFTSTSAFSPQFTHLRQSKYCEAVEGFTPKVLPKPTLQLKDCITQFTNVERLGADDPWYCPKCKKHQQATKKFDIWSLPKVLIIHLKRFSFSRSWRDKIDTLVDFPAENLDMSNYVLNPTQKKQKTPVYNLIGVANHFGGLGGGHYTAYAWNPLLKSWYSFDDALVTQTTSSNVVTRSAYVLFYQLQEEGQA